MNSTSSSTAAQPPLILCIDDPDVALRVLSGGGFLECRSQDFERGIIRR